MKALLVDDEPLALIGLQKTLEREISDIEVVASYSDPKEAVAGALKFLPDVVFLDIRMPEIDGLQLARQIQAAVPGIEIVFVTGYNQYAVNAFELYALDYLMKPIQRKRLQQTITRIREKLSMKGLVKSSATDPPLISCFNRIGFKSPGMELQSVKWRTSKAQELFAFLLHHRHRTVSRSVLLELLWPDIEEAKAAQHLYTAIYHIRQTLKKHKMDMISIRVGDVQAGYQLEIGEARVDVEMWEYDMKQLGDIDADTCDAYEHVLGMYTGDYLGEYEFLWAEHERERLRLLWLYQMKKLSGFYEQRGQKEKAIQVNLHIQRICPDDEESYFLLMKLYHAAGNIVGVEEQYLLLKQRIERELELPISADITRWYKQWKSLNPILSSETTIRNRSGRTAKL
ncbi:response regulator [Paenibacillus donghaensis]|uniref:response regulator n=1 Tax=Paenibacillus donghaensis TaxID=414771 RepID=UPI00188455B6|nr:response regulator [Paenibacillus donghaensis]MBE9913749.1 response regulator [Paenibacillus donghaensis]